MAQAFVTSVIPTLLKVAQPYDLNGKTEQSTACIISNNNPGGLSPATPGGGAKVYMKLGRRPIGPIHFLNTSRALQP
eukprot:3439691-Karenia_brevis.AAC.1